MCGIIGAISIDGSPVNEKVIDQFQDQKSRGMEGFGASMLVAEGDQEQMKTFRATMAQKALLDLYMKESKLILFHHRTPTSSDNLLSQTHPILVSSDVLDYDWLIAHNGMISNSDELKKKHNELGIEYSTDIGTTHRGFNDSESLAVELALFLERKKKEIEARGSAAVIGLQIDKATQKPVTFFYGKNTGNPLHASRNNHYIMVSSEGKGDLVEAGKFTFVDLTHPKLKQKTYDMEIPYSYVQRNYGYDHNRTALPVGTGQPTSPTRTANKDDDDLDGNRYFQSEQTTGQDVLDESMEPEDWIQNRGEEYTEELEEILGQFILAVCDAQAVDYAPEEIKRMTEAMERITKEMTDDFASEVLANAARDGEVTVTENEPEKEEQTTAGAS